MAWNVLVERRIGGDQGDGPGVEAPEETEVVTMDQRVVACVDLGHARVLL